MVDPAAIADYNTMSSNYNNEAERIKGSYVSLVAYFPANSHIQTGTGEITIILPH